MTTGGAPVPVIYGGTGSTSLTDGAILIGNGTSAPATVALTNGQLPIGLTGADPVAASITQPAAGITVTGGAGTITLNLANDLSALEGLGSTGIAVRSASDTWVQRTVTGTANKIDVTNGDGVSGNPTLTISDVIFNWTLLESQTVSGSPSSLDFVTGFNNAIYSEYALVFNSIGGSVNSYPLFSLSADSGGTWTLPMSYLKELAATVSSFNNVTSLSVSVTTRAGTAKRGLMRITPQGIGPRTNFYGYLYNVVDTDAGSFWGMALSASSINGIRMFNSAGTLSGGSAQLYGKR